MKSKSLLGIVGAVLVTVLATVGIALFFTGGSNDSAGDVGANPEVTKSAETYADPTEITEVLKARGATGCTDDVERTECRFQNRYVAATVLPTGGPLSVDTALQSWKSGLGQSVLGDDSPFAVLYGPNWLVTGPQNLMVGVWPKLGGAMVRCDRPFGTCR